MKSAHQGRQETSKIPFGPESFKWITFRFRCIGFGGSVCLRTANAINEMWLKPLLWFVCAIKAFIVFKVLLMIIVVDFCILYATFTQY